MANYLFADGHVASLEPVKTVDPRYGDALSNTLSSLARSSDPQPPTLPKFKLPIISSGMSSAPTFEESASADLGLIYGLSPATHPIQ